MFRLLCDSKQGGNESLDVVVGVRVTQTNPQQGLTCGDAGGTDDGDEEAAAAEFRAGGNCAVWITKDDGHNLAHRSTTSNHFVVCKPLMKFTSQVQQPIPAVGFALHDFQGG